jgi:hypothetical protein
MAVLMQTSSKTQVGTDQSSRDQEILESVLRECAQFYASKKTRTLTVFDRPHGEFLLMDEGWDGFKHIHRVWVHVELADGKFLIQKDGTEDGIAVDLINAGIPKERIVLAFQHPARRQYSEFATS